MKLVLIFFCFISCAKSHKIADEINTQITNTLEEWNLAVDVETTVNNDIVNINILYKYRDLRNEKGEKIAPYYYDKSSNGLIIQTLFHSLKDEFKNYKKVHFKLQFEASTDIATFKFDEDAKKEIAAVFENKLFYDNVIFSLESFTYDDITFFNSILKNTINDVKQIDFPVKFDFPVLDYWQILQLYSDFCNYATIDDLEKVEIFILLIHSLNNDYKKYANVGVDLKRGVDY